MYPATIPPLLPPSSRRAQVFAVAVLTLALAWIYLYGVTAYPLKWEEPRRALVAFEMVARQDYVVPHLLGEPYRNKPPLHNWLIVLAAGNDSARIVPLTVRLPSLLAALGTALLLFVLGFGAGKAPHPLPALLFLTAAVPIQFGRAGETDMLFTFLLMSAIAAFDLGRRRRSPAIQWVLAQAFVALAVLAKGVAPLFFYPPVFFLVSRRRAEFPFSARAFVLGAVMLLLIVSAWIAPFAAESSLAALFRQASVEIAERTPLHQSAPGANRQPPYPIMLFLAAFPWSLVLLALLFRRVRRAAGGLRAEPYLALATAVAVWGVLALAIVPRARPRYVLPLIPCAAVVAAFVLAPPRARDAAPLAGRRRSVLARGRAWLVLGGVLVALVLVASQETLAATPRTERLSLVIATTAVGLLVVVAGAWVSRRGNPLVAWVLVLGLLYGVAFTGLWERRDADKRMQEVRAAAVLAAAVPDASTPIVCRPGFNRPMAYALVHRLGRPLDTRAPAGEYVFFAPAGEEPPPGSRRVAAAGGIAAYHVAAPDAGRPVAAQR